MRYHRFQLLISRGPGGGYTVQALTPRGEGRGYFSLPFSIGEVGQSFRRSVRAGRDLGPPQTASAPSLKSLGEQLFRTLFQDEILRLYERSLDLLAADSGSGLRIELTLDPRDADLAALQALPWELLRQPDTPALLSLSRRQPIVRYFMVARPVYAAAYPRTLRILAVTAQPRHLPPLNLAREFANLRQAVNSAAGIEVVQPAAPTLAALRQALRSRECHVLHFMGHGGSTATPTQSVLFFETEDGDEAPVRGMDLMNKLADFPTLRLVVLNACESAAMPGGVMERTEPDVFSGVASSLVLGGMPAVVAMQLPISDSAAIAFSRAFYQRLAAGDPVDAAVAEGRQEIHSIDPWGMEWATPVLFLRTRTGELYPGKTVWDPAAWKKRARQLIVVLLGLLLSGGAGLAIRNWRVERLVTEGAALFQQGRWSAAHERFQAALKLSPGSSELLSDLAGAEEKLGDVQAAEEHYREAVLRQPDSAEHLYNLGHFLAGRKSYGEAYRFLSQAVARDPQRADAYGELAQAAAGLGMLGKARAFLQVALRLDPERPALYRRFGELELAAGNPRAALLPLEEAHRRYPQGDLGRVETAWLRAEAYDQLGDASSTCREIRELRRLDPLGIAPWAERAKPIASRRDCPSDP